MKKHESGARMMLTVRHFLSDPAGVSAKLKEALGPDELAILEAALPRYAPETLISVVLSDADLETLSTRAIETAG